MGIFSKDNGSKKPHKDDKKPKQDPENFGAISSYKAHRGEDGRFIGVSRPHIRSKQQQSEREELGSEASTPEGKLPVTYTSQTAANGTCYMPDAGLVEKDLEGKRWIHRRNDPERWEPPPSDSSRGSSQSTYRGGTRYFDQRDEFDPRHDGEPNLYMPAPAGRQAAPQQEAAGPAPQDPLGQGTRSQSRGNHGERAPASRSGSTHGPALAQQPQDPQGSRAAAADLLRPVAGGGNNGNNPMRPSPAGRG